MSPTKDLASKGEVMRFEGSDIDGGEQRGAGGDEEGEGGGHHFYPRSRAGGKDRVTQMKSRGLDYDESFGDEASSGGDSEGAVLDDGEDEDDDDDDDIAYDDSYDDNIFTPSRDGYDVPYGDDCRSGWMDSYGAEAMSSASKQLEGEYARQGRALIALALSL